MLYDRLFLGQCNTHVAIQSGKGNPGQAKVRTAPRSGSLNQSVFVVLIFNLYLRERRLKLYLLNYLYFVIPAHPNSK